MSEILTNRELRRYQNQISLKEIGIEGQEKLKQAKVVIIGVGGIGTFVLKHLAMSGIGEIGIIDNSIVEESNIHRQTLYGTSDLGKQKAIISKQKINELNAQCSVNIHNLYVTYDNIEAICEKYDIIVDATNDHSIKLAIQKYCLQCDKPFLYGTIREFEVEIGIITDCEFNEKNIDIGESKNKKEKGFLSITAGFAGSLISLEVINLITRKSERKGVLIKKFNVLEIL